MRRIYQSTQRRTLRLASDGPDGDGKGSRHEMRSGCGREARDNGAAALTPGPSHTIGQKPRVAVELTEPDLEAALVRDGFDLYLLIYAVVDGIAGV